MRARILIPILILLVAFCGALGFAVYTNVTTSTTELLDKQLDNTLSSIESNLATAKNEGIVTDETFQKIITNLGVADGGVFVVNENGVIIADSQQLMTGQSILSEGWYDEAKRTPRSEFSAVYGQTEIYAHSVVLDGKLVVSYLPNSSISELFMTPLYVIGVIGVISVTLVGIVVYFLITRLLINPIESLDEQIEELKKGTPIDMEPLKRNSQLVAMAKQLNKLIEGHDKGGGQATPKQQAPPPQDENITSFEFIEALREAFDVYRQTIVSKGIKFSMFVDNTMPSVVRANRETMLASMHALFASALNLAQPGTKIEAKVTLANSDQAVNSETVAIIFEVNYNGQKQAVLLEAKKG